MRWLVRVLKNKFILLVMVFGVTFGVGALVGGQFSDQPIMPTVEEGKTLNILFMGIDARDAKSNSRSDTMILASINTKTKRIAMISIPRDTHIKNFLGRSEKINSVNYVKGPEAACKEVAKLLDTDVNYYVVTNFAGFGKIVDSLGGVHINVESDMHHADSVNPELAINIHKGYQYMDGHTALNYVRYRGGPTADIGRTQRQQQFIKALVKEMFQAKTITKLPKLIPEISKNVHTNIPLKDMIYLAQAAKDFEKSDAIVAQTLPGYPYTDPSTGASYWEVDKDTATTIIADLLNGKKFSVISDPPNWIEKSTAKAVPQEQIIDEVNKQEELDQENEQDQTAEGQQGTDLTNETSEDGNNDTEGSSSNPDNNGGSADNTNSDGYTNNTSQPPVGTTDQVNTPDAGITSPESNPTSQVPSGTGQ